MEDLLKIKCPYCGAVLSVKSQAGIESKNVTCPICKQKSKFRDFKVISEKQNEEATQYPDYETESGYNARSNRTTQYYEEINLTLGRIKVVSSGKTFQLRIGKNIIGRQAQQSTADIQIPTEGSKRMSREHLIIELKKVQGKGIVHYASLYKQNVNETLINNVPLEYGDCVVLSHGDVINLPDAKVKFEIPDEEGTEI